MASVQGTHTWLTSPNITCTVGCSTKREGKSIYARWRIEVSPLTSGSYTATMALTIVMNEVRIADAVQIKNTTGTWGNPIIKYYPSSTGWTYIGDITDTSVDTLPVRVRFTSSAGHVLHLEGEESIEPFEIPTAPTSVTVSRANVAQLSTSFTVNWSGQSAGTGELTGYYIQARIGTSGSWTTLKTGSGTSASMNLSGLSSLARGSTVYIRVAVADILGYMSSYSTAMASIYFIDYPDAPTNIQSSIELVPLYDTNISLSWSVPSADVGSISSYKIYYLSGSSWVYLTTSYSNTANVNLSIPYTDRGATTYFAVSAVDSNGLESEISSNSVGVRLTNLPVAPTWINVEKNIIKTNETINVSWGGASSLDSDIAYYVLQYRYYDGVSWSSWTDGEYLTEESCHCNPLNMFPNLKNGDMIDARVGVVDEYELRSESYRKISSYINVVGGGIKVYVNGSYKDGTAYIRKDGVWQQGVAYVRHNSVWEEGV